MALRKAALAKSVILFSLAMAPALGQPAFARHHGDGGPAGGRDSGGGNSNNPPECYPGRACGLNAAVYVVPHRSFSDGRDSGGGNCDGRACPSDDGYSPIVPERN